MGTHIQNISDRLAIIASPRLWLEDAAIQQALTTAQLPGMRGMALWQTIAARAASARRF